MDRKSLYCEYCGLPLQGTPLAAEVQSCSGVLLVGEEGTCQGSGEVAEFCPRCGDHLNEDATSCSCDKED